MNPVEPLPTPPIVKVRDHLRRRKTAYAATASFIAGSALGLKLNRDALMVTLAFIEEKGLTDELFNPETIV